MDLLEKVRGRRQRGCSRWSRRSSRGRLVHELKFKAVRSLPHLSLSLFFHTKTPSPLRALHLFLLVIAQQDGGLNGRVTTSTPGSTLLWQNRRPFVQSCSGWSPRQVGDGGCR